MLMVYNVKRKQTEEEVGRRKKNEHLEMMKSQKNSNIKNSFVYLLDVNK